MSQMHHAAQAYSRPDAPVRTQRMIEYDLLARTTQRLSAATLRRDADFPAFAAAISDNIRLWTAFAADLANPGNSLPETLRARLFYLYQFTVAHSSKVMADGAAVDALVDINISVLRGLRGQTEGGA